MCDELDRQETASFIEVEKLRSLLRPALRFQYEEWPVETVEEKALRELAEQYHTRCDAYDRTICTGISPRTGEAMPVDAYQFRSINANARKVRDEIIWQGRSMGFTDEQVIRAIQNYVERLE